MSIGGSELRLSTFCWTEPECRTAAGCFKDSTEESEKAVRRKAQVEDIPKKARNKRETGCRYKKKVSLVMED